MDNFKKGETLCYIFVYALRLLQDGQCYTDRVATGTLPVPSKLQEP